MKICLTGKTMTYLSGQPMYVLSVAKELKERGHDVSIVSDWSNNDIRKYLVDRNIKCLNEPEEEYDLVLISESGRRTRGKKRINIVHSEYDCETPIPNLDGYICIRPSIQEHIVKMHGIPKSKTTVIYNGVDMDRFYPRGMGQGMLAPCTLDKLREPFLNTLISLATRDNPLTIMGDYYGAKLTYSDNVHIVPSTFHIEEEIPKYESVHGILLGRVNLEAYACGIDSYIWNPETLAVKKYEPENFEEDHDIKNVVNKILIYAQTI